MIDIDEENPSEEEIKDFIIERKPKRFRKNAIALNNRMKEIWQEKFGINIDELDVDFSIYNQHLYPQISREEENLYFSNVPDGVNEWILSPVLYPAIDYIFFDAVSCLMELSARIAREREEEVWDLWE